MGPDLREPRFQMVAPLIFFFSISILKNNFIKSIINIIIQYYIVFISFEYASTYIYISPGHACMYILL